MKGLLMILVVGITVLSQSVFAAPWSFGPALQGQGQRGQHQGPSQFDKREMRRERRMAPDRDERSHRRLTDEERRDLRRDIDQADREIYRRDHRR